MSSALARLQQLVAGLGGLLADAVRRAQSASAGGAGDDSLAAVAASGPRAAGREADYELVIEAIREGYLLHYERGRVIPPDDPDLTLLGGDRLYALGLARLAELGDVAAVAELADVISLCAQARAAGDPELAEAAWRAGAVAVGSGAPAGLARAKALARAGDPGALGALRAAAGKS